jgi:hypothetical protein
MLIKRRTNSELKLDPSTVNPYFSRIEPWGLSTSNLVDSPHAQTGDLLGLPAQPAWNMGSDAFAVLVAEATAWLQDATARSVSPLVSDQAFEELDEDFEIDLVAPRRVRRIVSIEIVRRTGRRQPDPFPDEYRTLLDE